MRCPACKKEIPNSLTFCREHWMQLPPELRDRITDSWGDGRRISVAEGQAYLLAKGNQASIGQEALVEKFLCPGCMHGPNPRECSAYKFLKAGTAEGGYCSGHVPGTAMYPHGKFALGLPKGFNRLGPTHFEPGMIRLWLRGTHPDWDKFNIPVWALKQGEFFFVRTYQPRRNYGIVDVLEGGDFELCADAVDVTPFHGDLD